MADGFAILDKKAHGGLTGAPAWGAVASLAVGTFASVTTEFLPIGLLTNIANSLGITEGRAGLMVTTPGIVAAIAAPTLIVASGRLDRRIVLLVLSALLVLSNVLAAVAPNLALMLVARFLLGLCVGGFWTFAPGATGYMVPAALQARAMSYVLAGISVATVAGVPAGALLGNLLGWRVTFGVTAVVSAAVLVFQLSVLPRMPTCQASRVRDLLRPLSSSGARRVLVVSLIIMTAHFGAYTYLRPMLQQVFGLSPGLITTSLLMYGVAGFVSTFVGGQLVVKSVRGTLMFAAALMATLLLYSAFFGGGVSIGLLVSVAWGIAFGLVPLSVTTWMLEAFPEAPDIGQAVLVCFLQIALSLGSLVGGFLVDGFGVNSALMVAGGLSTLALAVIGLSLGSRSHASPVGEAASNAG